MPWLVALSLFAAAALLFLVQPIIGKAVLPRFGGGPGVWATCLFFFQTAVLAGFAVATGLAARMPVARQKHLLASLVLLALGSLVLAGFVFPFAAVPLGVAESWAPPGDGSPVLWLLMVLALLVGLPCVALAASGVLVQQWHATPVRDPWALIPASTGGALVLLLAYPFFIEPWLSMTAQGWLWSSGFVVVAGLVLGLVRSTPPVPAEAAESSSPRTKVGPHKAKAEPTDAIIAEPPTWPRRIAWTARAFVPSCFLLAMTTHFTTDVAPHPLLWCLPLALYLLTFVLAFGRLPSVIHLGSVVLMPFAVLILAYLDQADTLRFPFLSWMPFFLNLAVLFVLGMACHGEAARTRPTVDPLPEFCLWLGLGAALGGAFNALLAPLLFTGVLEYPLALLFAAFALPTLAQGRPVRSSAIPVIGLMVLLLIVLLVLRLGSPEEMAWSRRLRGGGLAWIVGSAVLSLLAALGVGWFARENRSEHVLDFLWPAVVLVWTTALQATMTDSMGTSGIGLLIVVALALVAATVVRGWSFGKDGQWLRACSLFPPLLMGLLATGYLLDLLDTIQKREAVRGGPSSLPFDASTRLLFLLPMALASLGTDRPLRFGLGLGAVLLVGQLTDDSASSLPLHRERSFFGTIAVWERGESHRLIQGSTLMGVQAMSANRRGEALTYYHRTSPIGEVFAALEPRRVPVAVLGLGAGTLASYGQAGQEFVLFEIDPALIRVARNPDYFTYLQDAEQRGVRLEVVPGDGRLQLGKTADDHYGLIVVDAHNSDAVPTHLCTREAIDLYRRKLAPGGVIAFHTSNRYLALTPILGDLAADAGLIAYQRYDDNDRLPGKNTSDWVVLARQEADVAPIVAGPGWKKLASRPGRPVWRDDYADVIGALRFRNWAAE